MFLVLAFAVFLLIYFYSTRIFLKGTSGLPFSPHKTYCQLVGGVTAYRLQGDARNPLVVLVHGFSSGSVVWNSLSSFLVSKGYYVLTYDLHGRGHSHSSEQPHNLDFFVKQLEELLQALNLSDAQRPFYLVGFSMGGVIVSQFTRLHPELVKLLVLLAPAGLPTRKPPLSSLLTIPVLREVLFNLISRKTMTKVLQKQLARARTISDDAYTFTEQLVSFSLNEQFARNPVFFRSILSTLIHFELDRQHALFEHMGTKLQSLPILVIWGDQDDTCPYANCTTLKKLIPHAQVLVVSNGAHSSCLEYPSTVNTGVLSFLTTH